MDLSRLQNLLAQEEADRKNLAAAPDGMANFKARTNHTATLRLLAIELRRIMPQLEKAANHCCTCAAIGLSGCPIHNPTSESHP